MGLFDNSAAQQAHAQNVARVNAIDAQNRQIHLSNLGIRARALNKQARLPAQLQAIQTARLQQSAARQRELDRLVDESLMRNESDAVKIFRGMTGSGSGRMNLDSSALAELGRANAYRRNKLMRSREDLITSGYLDRFFAQNMRSQVKASVAAQPIYQPYIEGYTPSKVPQQNKFLNFALGIGSSALNAAVLEKSLQPPEIGQVNPFDFGDMTQNIPPFNLPTPAPAPAAVPFGVQPFNPVITPVNMRYQVGDRVGYE